MGQLIFFFYLILHVIEEITVKKKYIEREFFFNGYIVQVNLGRKRFWRDVRNYL